MNNKQKIESSTATKRIRRLWRETSLTALALVLSFSFGFGVIVSCSNFSLAQKNSKRIHWDKGKFTVGTLATEGNNAIWALNQEGNFDLPVITDFPLDKADSVIEIFNKLPKEKKIFGYICL